MGIFEHVSPLVFRYIPKDEELSDELKGYGDLDIFSRLQRIVPEVVVPRLYSLEGKVIDFSNENRDKIIPRRIDGIHEGTTTVSEVFSNYAERLKGRIKDIERLDLDFNLRESKRNDLVSDLVYFLTSVFSVEANMANDIRHHFRSGIDEFVHEDFGGGRIGSSTMPHKRNPVEYENIVSLWKVYVPRVTSAIMAQLTEHQGDSTNDFLLDNSFELAVALSYSTKYLEKNLGNLKVNV